MFGDESMGSALERIDACEAVHVPAREQAEAIAPGTSGIVSESEPGRMLTESLRRRLRSAAESSGQR